MESSDPVKHEVSDAFSKVFLVGSGACCEARGLCSLSMYISLEAQEPWQKAIVKVGVCWCI